MHCLILVTGDGTISRAELFAALRRRSDVDELLGFPKVRTPAHGVDHLTQHQGGGSVTEILEFFDVVDGDSDRQISLKEFQVGVRKWKVSLTLIGGGDADCWTGDGCTD